MLDLQTLSLSSVIASTISALFFILIWQLNREIEGIKLWLITMIFQPIGWILIFLRGYVVDWISILLGNIFIFSSVLLFLLGARTFFKLRKHNHKIFILYYSLFLPSFSYYTFFDVNIVARIFIIYGLSSIIMLQCAAIPFSTQKIKRTAGTYIFSSFCGITAFLMIIRLLTIIEFNEVNKLFTLSVANSINVFIGFLLSYGMGFTLVLLCHERRILDIEQLKEAAKLDAQLKNNYLAILSHELRTPLNGMIGTAQLMQKKQISDELKHDCDIIINAGKSLSDLSLEALTYASIIDIKKTPPQLNWLDLTPWLNNLIKLLRPLAEDKGLRLKLVTVKNLPKNVEIDSNKVRQVLINLIGNAIKYTDSGEVNLSVSYTKLTAKQVTETKGVFTFAVIDTGIGIPKIEQALLLKPFVQGSNRESKAQKTMTGGVGLGLAISKEILNAVDSQLNFTSKENEGSCFRFALQLNYSEQETLSTSELAKKEEVIKTGLNILVIEDVELNQNVILSMLGLDQHQVDLAKTGQQALNKAAKHLYDVILLDMQLPDMHGLTIYQTLRENKQHLNHHTAIIGLTATITPTDLQRYQQTDIIDIVQKPIILDRLRAVIKQSQNKEHTQTKLKPKSKEEKFNSEKTPQFSLFDPKAFAFLKENLDANELKNEINNLPHQLEIFSLTIKNAQQHQEFEMLSKSTHQLAGYSAQMGLTRLSKYASSIEMRLANGESVCLNELSKLCQDSVAEIIKNNQLI